MVRVIFVVETEEGSEVQAEGQDDSGSTQQTIWHPGGAGEHRVPQDLHSLRALGFYRPQNWRSRADVP